MAYEVFTPCKTNCGEVARAMSGGWQPPKNGQMVAESAIPLKPDMPDGALPGSTIAPLPTGAFLFVEAAFFAAANFEPENNSDCLWVTAGALFSTGRVFTFTVCSTAAGAFTFVEETLTLLDALIEWLEFFAKTAPGAKMLNNATSARSPQIAILGCLLFIDVSCSIRYYKHKWEWLNEPM